MTDGRQRIQRWSSVVAGLVSLIGIMWIMGFILQQARVAVRAQDMEEELGQLRARVAEIEERDEELAAGLEKLSAFNQIIRGAPQMLHEAELSAQITLLQENVDSIRAALGSDLERSLSVPLLRKDLVQLEAQVRERTTAASREIDRIYDQNKWFLGLMGTMAVGLLGLAVSNFLQARRDER